MKQTKTISLLGLIFIPIFAVSLMISDNFVDRFVEIKQFYFYFSAAIAVLIYFVSLLLRKSKPNTSIYINRIDGAIILFYIYNVIRLVLTPNYGFSEPYFITLSTIIVLYFVFKQLFIINQDKNFAYIKIMIFSVLVIGFVNVCWGFLQLYGFVPNFIELFKIGGSFGNPGPYTNYLVSIFPVSLGIWLFFNPKSSFDIILHKLSVLLSILIIVLLPATKSRASWIAALVTIAITVFIRYRNSKVYDIFLGNLPKKIIVITVAAIIAFSASKSIYSYKKDSADGRMFIWGLCADIIKDNPLFGSGFNTYKYMHNEYQSRYFASDKASKEEKNLADNSVHAFNEYLQISVELGLLGLILFLGLIYFVLTSKSEKRIDIDNEKQNSPFDIALISKIGVVSILVTALVSYPLRDLPIHLNLYFLIAIVSATTANKKLNINMPVFAKKGLAFAAVIGIIVFIGIQKKRYDASKEWKKTATIIKQGKVERALRNYEKLYSILKYNPYFLYNYGAELSQLKNFDKSIELLEETKYKINDADVYTYLGNSYEGINDYENAEYAFEKASNIVPHRLYPKYRLVFLYAKTNRINMARNLAIEVLNTEEKIKSDVTKQIKEGLYAFLQQFEEQAQNNN